MLTGWFLFFLNYFLKNCYQVEVVKDAKDIEMVVKEYCEKMKNKNKFNLSKQRTADKAKYKVYGR